VVLVGFMVLGSPPSPTATMERPSPDEARGPPGSGLRPIPRPAAPVAPAPEAPAATDGFLTVDSNEAAWVSVDGTRRGKTPLKRLPVPAGEHELTLESVATGERKVFSMGFETGKERKIMEIFQPGPRPR
jgi:hypothetical protein